MAVDGVEVEFSDIRNMTVSMVETGEPAGAPELNPGEAVWSLAKRRHCIAIIRDLFEVPRMRLERR